MSGHVLTTVVGRSREIAASAATRHIHPQPTHVDAPPPIAPLRLFPFEPWQARTIAGWVENEQELRRLAPSTPAPLTAEKVLKWLRPLGRRLVLRRGGGDELTGYAELNPMSRRADDYWLGHVILRPDLRNCGLGVKFVRLLTDHAFGRLGGTRLSLIVFPDNTPAIRCYRRAGFRSAGLEYHRFFGLGRKQAVLRLEIEATAALRSDVPA
jgi:RimJ/RimL family protein N-acetyltransferase